MGTVQEVATSPQSALDEAIKIANKIAACGPLGIKASLASAHLAVDAAQADALAALDAQRAALYRSKTFRKAEKQKPKVGDRSITETEPCARTGTSGDLSNQSFETAVRSLGRSGTSFVHTGMQVRSIRS